jgi:hypothetical protein
MADLLSKQQLAQLAEELKQLPPRKGYRPTFLQIAGFPDRENVWSNILKFYLDSTNGHELGNAVFRAFMSILDIKVAPDVVVRARREEVIEGGKRIDLVVETADMVVGIENKVNHELNNDLVAYRQHLDCLTYGRHVHAVVLSLYRIPDDQRVAGWSFVTYDRFCAKLLAILKLFQNDNKYVMFLEDFVTSIVKPNQGSTMDPQRLEYFKQHRAEFDMLLKEVAALKLDMRRKVETLLAALQAAPPPSRVRRDSGLLALGFESDEGLKELVWNRIDIAADFALIIDIILEPDGWKISFYNHAGPLSKAEQWIKERGIVQYHLIENPYFTAKYHWRAIVDDPAAFGYDADIEQVREWALKFLKQVLPQ